MAPPPSEIKMLKANQDLTGLTLISIDPGLNNVGVAIYKIELLPVFKICRIEAFTLSAPRLVDDCGLDDEDYSERTIKRHVILRHFKKILENHTPDIVVCESPFFNPKMPSSFAVLTEVVASLFDQVILFNSRCQFSVLAPKLVKKTFSIAGKKGKDVVKEAVAAVSLLTDVLVNDIDGLDEHSIDAIAVGYSWIIERTNFLRGSDGKEATR